MSTRRESELPCCSLQPGLRSLRRQRSLARPRSREAARPRDLPWPGVHMEMLGPVIAGGVKRIVDALPRGGLGFLEQNAHVPSFVGRLRSAAEVLGMAASSSSARPPGRVTWTTIAVSGTRADRSRGRPARRRRDQPGVRRGAPRVLGMGVTRECVGAGPRSRRGHLRRRADGAQDPGIRPAPRSARAYRTRGHLTDRVVKRARRCAGGRSSGG